MPRPSSLVGMVPDVPDLGACCICEGRAPKIYVRNIVMLSQEAPVPGTGWGCLNCHLPDNGAIAVLCDDCFHKFIHQEVELRFVIKGLPVHGDRIAYAELPFKFFDHRPEFHQEEIMSGPSRGAEWEMRQ